MKKVFYFILLLYVIYLFCGGKLEHKTEDELIYDKYFKETKNAELTFYVLKYCNVYRPNDKNFISLAFALCKKESGYKKNVWNINLNKKTGEIDSIDRGYFQLNNKTFKWLKKDKFYDAEINISHGIFLLNDCLEISKNERDAVHIYNGGVRAFYRNSFRRETKLHADRVLKEMDRLNRL